MYEYRQHAGSLSLLILKLNKAGDTQKQITSFFLNNIGLCRYEYILAKNQKTILKDTVAFVRWMNEGMPVQVGENFRVEGRARCRAVGCVQSLLLLPRKKPEAVSGTAFFPSSR